ncbi:hypothetical protein [Bacillus methanolicus]|uniref:hypothetical protein n=1 Tax=Bacillus methanolicus TaxID=1471 RepID=UPI00054E722B
MKKIVLFFLYFLMFGLPLHAYGKLEVPILIYHSIDEYKGHGSRELYVTPEIFEKQMMYLKKSGIFSIQSHTATHPDLTKTKKYEYELKESKEKLNKSRANRLSLLHIRMETSMPK